MPLPGELNAAWETPLGRRGRGAPLHTRRKFCASKWAKTETAELTAGREEGGGVLAEIHVGKLGGHVVA